MKSKTKKLLISFFIPFFILLISFIIGGLLPFGTKDIMTAYGHEAVLPYFYEFWDNVHVGKILFFSTRTGMGYDFSKVITYYLSDPINLLILIFPRNAILDVIKLLMIILTETLVSEKLCRFLYLLFLVFQDSYFSVVLMLL